MKLTDDWTEDIRRTRLTQINSGAAQRATLEARRGPVWNASELTADFTVLGFAAPFVVVRRKSDNCLGSLLFQQDSRYYFGFKEDK
ncbi:MAG: hypothetical protein ACREIC_22105 [Limisphaerales bacterium]